MAAPNVRRSAINLLRSVANPVMHITSTYPSSSHFAAEVTAELPSRTFVHSGIGCDDIRQTVGSLTRLGKFVVLVTNLGAHRQHSAAFPATQVRVVPFTDFTRVAETLRPADVVVVDLRDEIAERLIRKIPASIPCVQIGVWGPAPTYRSGPTFANVHATAEAAANNSAAIVTQTATSTLAPTTDCSFIAHDWCGWDERHRRFTACPGGQTLVCQPWMRQADWDKAQLEWFEQFSAEIIVHRCPSGPYRETGDTMGTVAEIIVRLKKQLP